MKVELIDFTTDALEKLLFTKQTRLSMNGALLEEIKGWPHEKKMQELEYMRGTIQSSWEFVSYTFSIEGVSRAFTHQLVRTRAGHYAQQSQRTVNMAGFEYVTPREIENSKQEAAEFSREDLIVGEIKLTSKDTYDSIMEDINYGYQLLLEKGTNPQDARGVLPTNIATNIIAGFSLRTLADMAKLRLCTRTQGEYQDVFREMRKKVIEVHPWTDSFIRVHCAAVGTCCFPNFKECPIKPSIFNPDTGMRNDGNATRFPSTREEIHKIWEQTRFEAVPKQDAEMKGK